MAMGEELVEIKTNFFIGNYQAVINEADSLNSPNSLINAEKRLFVFRSNIALQNYSFVLDEVDASSPTELQIAKLLALYLSGEDCDKARAGFAEFAKKHSTSELGGQFYFIAAATFFLHEGDLEEALRCALKSSWLEGKALTVQIYLAMNRFDMAEKELKQMQQIDDDSVITQIAQAWTLSSMGADKANQASFIYEELIEKFGATSLLLNGQAVCKIGCGQLSEAEPLLLQALEKSPNDKNTIIALTVCSRHLNKPLDTINRKLKQVRSSGGTNSYLADLDHHEQTFEKAAARYKFN